MLRDPELDAVMIGTPNESHCGLAKLAIASGKAFALEKPVAMDAAEAAELAQLLKASPVPHLICFSYRYKKAARYARQLINEGRLGRILHVHSQYMQGWAMDERIPLVWRFRKEKTGSGAIGDLGSHILDLTRFLIGGTERVVADAGTIVPQRDLLDGSGQGEVDVDDFCHVLSRLEGGISSTMAISASRAVAAITSGSRFTARRARSSTGWRRTIRSASDWTATRRSARSTSRRRSMLIKCDPSSSCCRAAETGSTRQSRMGWRISGRWTPS